jgi:hypothetical protein
MPGGTTLQRGNILFEQALQLTVTPPTITTGVITQQTVTVPGLVPGDIIDWNMLTFTSNLISVTNMAVLASNTLTINWSTEGATVSGAAAQTFELIVSRIENYSLVGFAGLPTSIT